MVPQRVAREQSQQLEKKKPLNFPQSSASMEETVVSLSTPCTYKNMEQH